MATNVASIVRLMLVTDDALIGGRDLVSLIEAAVRGGVTSVQLRLENASARDLAALVRRVRAAATVPVLVNDRADVALAVGADGVHLGPDDVPVPLIRAISPPGFLIGASVGSLAEVDGGRGADYWGVGPFRQTSTKSGAGAPLGAEGFAALVRHAEGRVCVAIGGVRPDDVPAVLAAGGVGVAVVSGILGAVDVETAAREYLTGFPP